MRILLAQPRGFCAGVEMAVAALDRALELYGTPLYAFHQIVHNTFVIADFRSRGVVFVEEIGDVPPRATVVFSAHGVSPAVRAEAAARQLRVVDATCPLVTKVHSEAKRFARDGYTIVLVAHAGHDEAVGVTGEAPGQVRIVETTADVEALAIPDESRVAYLTQTTLSVDDTRRVVEALQRRFPHIQGPPREDICYATQNRQAAVRALALETDMILVVGSDNSSNSRRLVEVAESCGVRARRVDGPDELRLEWFDGVETLGVTSGASVPEPLLRSVLTWLQAYFGGNVVQRSIMSETVHFLLPGPVRPRTPHPVHEPSPAPAG